MLSIEDVVLAIFVAVLKFSTVDPTLELSVLDTLPTPDVEEEANSLPVSVVDSILVEEGPNSPVVSISLVDTNVLKLPVGDAVVLSTINVKEDPASLLFSDVDCAVEEVPG